MDNDKFYPTSIRLPYQLKLKIINDCKNENRSISQQIVYILKKYYNKKK